MSRIPLAVALVLAPGLALAQVPPVPVPPGNPITAEKAVLGKILFWDEQLSTDDTVACGTCHLPANGGSDPRRGAAPGLDGVFRTPDDVFGSPGVPAMDTDGSPIVDPFFGLGPQVTTRSAPMIYGSLWSPLLFWDGRAGPRFDDPETGAPVLVAGGALEAQAVAPLLNDVEMAHRGATWDGLTDKLDRVVPLELADALPADVEAALAARPTYADLFEAAFGDRAITAARIGLALATYERTLVPDQTPFDRFNTGDPTALTPGQVRGLNAFRATTCNACHAGTLFTDHTFRNLGLRPPFEDAGRQDVTGIPGDAGRFKVPSLRNVGLKTEFMHTGQFQTLEQVVNFYIGPPGGGPRPPGTDPLVAGVNIPPGDVGPMVDFLRNALTDPRVAAEAFPFDRPALHARPGACQNGVDDDGDGLSDLLDPGCLMGTDTAETDFRRLCDDGRDNDRDGQVDGADPDCDTSVLGLEVDGFAAGQVTTFTARDAMPGASATLLASLAGPGVGPCAPGGVVCVDLVAPVLLGTRTVASDGTATWQVAVPAGLAGRTAAFQAVWRLGSDGRTSEVVVATSP